MNAENVLEERHQGHVHDERDRPVGDIEPNEPAQELVRAAYPIAPRPAPVADEIVKDGRFDRDGGRRYRRHPSYLHEQP